MDGSALDWDLLGRKTTLVFFFSPRMTSVTECLGCYQTIQDEREGANLEVLGVCIDPVKAEDLAQFLREAGYTFPVVIDGNGSLREIYAPSSIPEAYFFADGWRYLGSVPGFPEEGTPHRAEVYTNLLRRGVGLDIRLRNDPTTSPWPEIPDFEWVSPDGSRRTHRDLAGAPYLVAFVAADCHVCRAQLEFFRLLYQDFAADGLEILAVVVTEGVDPGAFRQERNLPFPVAADEGGALRRALFYRGSVPDTFVVDRQGRIRFRHTTFDDEEEALYRMEVRELLGRANPPILLASGPSGVRRCRICHETEYFDWKLSGHARAMRSLIEIGRAEDPECVRCHVVGWDEPGGFNAEGGERARLLQDVQCESCHGAGGPHRALDGGERKISSATCAGCHDEEHSLGFDFGRAVGLVEHSLDLSAGGPETLARAARLREQRKRQLLEPQGAYVGAARCAGCHPAQQERWAASPHARAWDLLAPGERREADCRRCHSTGFERRWAAPPPDPTGAVPTAPPSAGVQCEACHGPGEDHVAAGTPERFAATILGLGHKCPECVLRQMCASCHDRANDPGFDLERALPPVRSMCRGETTR